MDRVAPWAFGRFVAWRLVCAAILVILLLTALFIVVEVLPVDATRMLLPRQCFAPCALRDQLIHQWGLDRPFLDRYAIFLWNTLTGNFGPSLRFGYGTPVWNIIAARLPGTLALVGAVTVVLALLSIPIGTRLSSRKGGVLDQIVSFFLAWGFAVPPILLALLGTFVFVLVYPVFPVGPGASPDPLVQAGNEVAARVLPGLVAIGTLLGLFVWVVRDDPLRSPEDLSSRPPGEWRHERKTMAARTVGVLPRFLAALPILFPWAVVTVLLAEGIGIYAGLGQLLWYGFLYVDYVLVVGVIVVLALLVVLPVVVAADILRYWMTRSWRRIDEDRVAAFRVDRADPLRWLVKTVGSVFGLLGLVLILGILVLSLTAPLIAGPYPTQFDRVQILLPPSQAHPLGTDGQGYDTATLLVYGGQALPAVAALGFLLAFLAGIAAVMAIGFLGERGATFIEIPVDVFLILSLPFLFLLVAVYGRGTEVWAPALFGWPVATRLLLLDTTRMARASRPGSQRRITVEERGSRALRLAWGSGPLILAAALLASSFTVIAWAVMGFFGLLPISAGSPQTWGEMISSAYENLALLRGAYWLFVPPLLCILVAALGPILLTLRLKRIYDEAPRIALPATIPAPVAPVAPPGSEP